MTSTRFGWYVPNSTNEYVGDWADLTHTINYRTRTSFINNARIPLTKNTDLLEHRCCVSPLGIDPMYAKHISNHLRFIRLLHSIYAKLVKWHTASRDLHADRQLTCALLRNVVPSWSAASAVRPWSSYVCSNEWCMYFEINLRFSTRSCVFPTCVH